MWCLCDLLRRVSIYSPGGACIVSLRGTEPDPGPVTMTSVGTNRGCGPVVRRGQSKSRECRAKASSGSGLLYAQGRGGPGLGNRLRAAVTQARGSVGTGGSGLAWGTEVERQRRHQAVLGGGAQGTGAGHWRGLTAGAAQRNMNGV